MTALASEASCLDLCRAGARPLARVAAGRRDAGAVLRSPASTWRCNGSGRGFNSPLARAACRAPRRRGCASRRSQMRRPQLRQVAPQDALAINAAIPISNRANPAARPFLLTGERGRPAALARLPDRRHLLRGGDRADRRPARASPRSCSTASATRLIPSTVCGVVFEGARRCTGCQFSFTCDGSLRRAPMAGDVGARARASPRRRSNGYVYAPVGWATHYHANYVVPYWASSLVKTANVGAHIFYRWRGGWGRPPAFLNRYAGVEPAIAWRGGFGQPTRGRAARRGGARRARRDAAAAEAREARAPIGSVDSFQRAVLRRYEPLQRDTANAMISRAGPRRPQPDQQPALGADRRRRRRPATPQQRPLGRWGSAVRRRESAAAGRRAAGAGRRGARHRRRRLAVAPRPARQASGDEPALRRPADLDLRAYVGARARASARSISARASPISAGPTTSSTSAAEALTARLEPISADARPARAARGGRRPLPPPSGARRSTPTRSSSPRARPRRWRRA